ncbi:oxygenase [Lithospermum erythrorhizon]|uniref:Oxygenase n=1 Tax=Lithospermum erythrorhizon TaxID=34254 RepID=A0AAV3QXL6_LITER
MELFFNLPALYLFLLFIVLFAKQRKKSRAFPTPPGPWRLPIIGSLHHLTGPLPHQTITKLSKKYGPIMYLRLGEVPYVIISSAKLAKEVLITHDPAFAARPDRLAMRVITYNCTDIAFGPYGDYWRQMRKICSVQFLSTKMVRSFSHVRQSEVAKLVEIIRSANGEPINLTENIGLLISSIIFRASFGKTYKEQARLLTTLAEVVSIAGGFDIADCYPSVKLLHKIYGTKTKIDKLQLEVDSILDRIIDDRKKSRIALGGADKSLDENLVDVLLNEKDNNKTEFPITNENIKAIIYDMFAAGTDNTSSAVQWALSELILHPEIMKKVQTEIRESTKGKKNVDEADIPNMKYLRMVIKETMRLHPLVSYLLPRQCIEQRQVGGYLIPLNTRVSINYWSIGRDPEYWEDPLMFKPERFEDNGINFNGGNLQYAPFGAGKRSCPGLAFGMSSLELTLAQLLYQFNWKLPQGMKLEDFDMTEASATLTLPRKTELFLVATPYYNN